MRRTTQVGAFVWCAFFAVDVLVVTYLGVGTIPFFALLRLCGLAHVLLVLRWLRRPGLSEAVRTGLDLSMHTLISGLIALMCIPFWGIESPYAAGICLVLVHRMVMAGQSWRRGLLMYGIPASTYPLTMAGGRWLVPQLAAQFHDTRALVIFGIYLSFVFGTAALATAGGHVVWSLSRAVFEARSFGRYKLKHRIGSGATGDVWLARHAALKRDVAVKVLRPEACNDVGISRFEREAQATAVLAHPNTVRIFDFGTTEDGLWYYAMELLEGETLAELVRREGPLPPARAIRLALQAARALSEAHSLGIVHRDVKPNNLFVTVVGGESDFVKVLDFGIARFFQHRSKADSTLTKSGVVLGTPAYMSPEAALSEEVDARADVYASGAVLYFMLTGHPPFEAASDGALGVLLSHINRVPERPSLRFGAPIPEELEQVVMRCLEKEPRARYPNAAALAQALGACGM